MSLFPSGIQLHVAARNRGSHNFFERLEVLHKPLQISQYPPISPEMDVEKLRSDLEDNNQGHLLKHWDTLNETEQQTFYRDLKSIDLAKLNQSFKKTTEEAEASKREKKDEKLQPIPPDHVGSVIGDDNKAKVNSWRDKGLQVISEGKVAVLLLAGGQGTRLGVSYPKGMYDVGLPSRKTLYQLQAERILKVQELAFKKTGKKCTVPWYIMTSEHTMDDTKRFFEDKNYFGLQRNDVVMFAQHTLPCLTNDGKIILDQPGKVARAPSGNGGLYEALLGKRLIDEMKKRGIEYFHVYCVDNILVKMADPVFIGFCIDKSAECGAKVVEKKIPEERVGLVVKCDGKFQVAEYSEITEDVQHKRDPDGRLTFREANLANHFFTINFLEKIVKELEPSLKFHIAKKKIPFVDDTGKRITPEKPNGIKLEKFIFDVFEFTEQFAVLEVAREEEFSPLKNGRGSPTDSPDTAQRDLYNLHYNYILRAGGKFIDGSNEDATVVCEISPLLSYAGEGLEDVVRDRQFSVKTKEIYLKAEDEEDERNGELPCKKVREG